MTTSGESCSISDYADRSKLVAPWGVSRGSPTPPACWRIARDEAGPFRLQQRSVPAGYYTLCRQGQYVFYCDPPCGRRRMPSSYAQTQAELEELVHTLVQPAGFALTDRNPNTGKGSSVTWRRQNAWRADEFRLLFLWYGRIASRAVYADVGVKVNLADRFIAVDGYPTAWIARRSTDQLIVREKHRHLPAGVAGMLRSDIIAGLAWIDRTYATAAAAIARLDSDDRNGVAKGTRAHADVVAHLRRLVVS